MRIKQILTLAMPVFMVSCGTSRIATGGDSVSLIGTEWAVEELNSAKVESDPESFSLRFGEDSRISGVGACNRLMGDYALLKRGALKIENLAATLMFCPNLDLEKEYMDALEGVTRYDVSGSTLTLYAGDEAVVVLKSVE